LHYCFIVEKEALSIEFLGPTQKLGLEGNFETTSKDTDSFILLLERYLFLFAFQDYVLILFYQIKITRFGR